MRTEWIDGEDLDMVLLLLRPANRLACQVAIKTGLRIGDVLALRPADLRQRMTVREAKTGKSRRVYLSKQLVDALRRQAGAVWVFPGRSDPTKHRTRQAVWADVKRAQRAMRLPANLGPHSCRKVYAVRQYHRTGDLAAVQAALQHSDPAVTMLYALADHLGQQRRASPGRRPSKP